MSFAYTDGSREVWLNPMGRLDKKDQALVDQGILARNPNRWLGQRPPALATDEKAEGWRWRQKEGESVARGLIPIPTGGHGVVLSKKRQMLPVWERVRDEPAAEESPDFEPPPERDPFAGLASGRSSVPSRNSTPTADGIQGGSIPFTPTADGIQSAANYGNAGTDDYFRRFLPQSFDAGRLGALEIDASAQFGLDRFVGKPPSLGGGKELFDYYQEKIKAK